MKRKRSEGEDQTGKMYQIVITAAVLLICTYTDIHDRKIYRAVILGYLLLAAAGKTVLFLSDHRCLPGNELVGWELAADCMPGIVCLMISFLTRQGIGYGDSILILVCGGSVGGMECLATVLTAFFWAGIWGFIRWRFFGMDSKAEIPFVPFLLIGFMIQNVGKIY